jgi:hypothetical protein
MSTLSQFLGGGEGTKSQHILTSTSYTVTGQLISVIAVGGGGSGAAVIVGSASRNQCSGGGGEIVMATHDFVYNNPLSITIGAGAAGTSVTRAAGNTISTVADGNDGGTSVVEFQNLVVRAYGGRRGTAGTGAQTTGLLNSYNSVGARGYGSSRSNDGVSPFTGNSTDAGGNSWTEQGTPHIDTSSQTQITTISAPPNSGCGSGFARISSQTSEERTATSGNGGSGRVILFWQ